MTGKSRYDMNSSFDACVTEWTSREIQLTRLHEEILSRREALLNCSLAYHHSQEVRTRQGAYNGEQAYIRNHKLLQDIKSVQERTFDEIHSSPTPRFMTLQKNYWAMVKSQVPMWEQDLGIKRPKGKGQGQTVRGQGQSSGSSARGKQRSSKKQRQRRQGKSPV